MHQHKRPDYDLFVTLKYIPDQWKLWEAEKNTQNNGILYVNKLLCIV